MPGLYSLATLAITTSIASGVEIQSGWYAPEENNAFTWIAEELPELACVLCLMIGVENNFCEDYERYIQYYYGAEDNMEYCHRNAFGDYD